MKRIIIGLIAVISCSFSAVRIQGQASVLGFGYGLGLGKQVVPMMLEAGLEGMVYNSPTVTSKGSYTEDGATVDYDGEFNLRSSRVGGYLKFTTPIADKLPVVGFLFRPVVHFGTQDLSLNIDGDIRFLGVGSKIEDGFNGKGSYVLIGFPFYLGPVYIEPAFGTQHIAAKGFGSYSNLPEAQVSLGVTF
jgi:hypothetical protein